MISIYLAMNMLRNLIRAVLGILFQQYRQIVVDTKIGGFLILAMPFAPFDVLNDIIWRFHK